MGPLPLRCGSGGRRRIGVLTASFWSGGIRRSGLGAQSSSCPITSRLRRWTRWWGSMTSCFWHAWPARSSRANLSRPARLPFVADQVSPGRDTGRHGEAGFFLYFLGITPRSGPTGGQNGLARPFRTISYSRPTAPRLLWSVAPRRAPGLTSLPPLLMASKASEVHA